MPYAENVGTRIHYRVEGSGPDLVLLHGFMDRLDGWRACGYTAALRPYYRLILVDSRGHGGSDKPHDTASYSLDRRVADVTVVLDALGVEQAHVWGYSMGGYIGLGIAQYAPHRLRTLVVGGAHPYARDQSAHRRLLGVGIAGGGESFVAAFVQGMGPIPDEYADSLRTADFRAWLAAAEDRIGIEDASAALTVPCCIYCGDADPLFAQAKQASEAMPAARFIALPGHSHVQAFERSSSILPDVLAFLRASQ